MSTRIGIVGMPNAGKSSLFNALTKAGAEAANYPFTTIEPNVAVVPVHDQRLEEVSETVHSSEIVWDTIDFHDIAGLVAGAHKGEGLGNRFLANIRETDALVHVVRAHGDENVIHPEGRVDPLADIETIETELILADLETAERRIDKVGKQARGGDRVAIAEEAWLTEVIGGLQAGRPARGVPVPDEAPHAARDLGSLTAKPVLFVANVDEGSDEVPGGDRRARRRPGRPGRGGLLADRVRALRARGRRGSGHAGRADVAPGRRPGRRHPAAAGRQRGLRPARAARLLHRRRGQARAVLASAPGPLGLACRRADPLGHPEGLRPGRGHRLAELVDAGGYAGARDRGTLRLEGRDYTMADGDVITVKFTP